MNKIIVKGYILPSGYENWGVTPDSVAEQLADAEGDLVVEINSGGGVITSAYEIANMLQQYQADGKGKVTTRITGMAASAAATIFISAADREVYKLGYFMQHRATGVAFGDQGNMSSAADVLAQIDEITAADLAYLTNRSPKKMAEMIRADYHLIGGDKMVAEGIATQVINGSSGEEPAKLLRDDDSVQAEQYAGAFELSQTNKDISPFYASLASAQQGSQGSNGSQGSRRGMFGWMMQKNSNTNTQTQKEKDFMTEEQHKQALDEALAKQKAEMTAQQQSEQAEAVQQEGERVQKILQYAGGMTDEAKKAIEQKTSAADFAVQIVESGGLKQAAQPPQNTPNLESSIPTQQMGEPQAEEQTPQQQILQAEKEGKIL